MRRKIQKIIISFLVLSFVFISFGLAQERALEVEYPSFGFRQIQKNLLPVYFKYIFNFIIGLAGLIALGALIYSGVRYLSSSGQPEKLKEARNQVLAAFWGIIILLSAYLILININPQLVLLKLEAPEEVILPPVPAEPPLAPPPHSDYLWRITEIASSTKKVAESSKQSSLDIRTLASRCSCQNTQPMCLCQKYVGGSCEAVYCYSARPTQPCSNDSQIKETQQDIVASRFEILYYKDRIINEREDFLLKIGNLEKEISFYNEEINEANIYLSKIGSEFEKRNQESLIQQLETRRDILVIKKGLYESLENKLQELVDLINEISPSLNRLLQLPDQCLPNVKEKCSGSCKGGCHDTLECAPVGCGGGNPCPMGEITSEVGTITNLENQIKGVSDEIMGLVAEIIVI